MAKNRVIIPANMITPPDAARMIVRSSLIAAPYDMREAYTDFCAPVDMGNNYGEEGDISNETRKIFKNFVDELTKLQDQYTLNEKKLMTMSKLQDLAQNHVKSVLSLADKYTNQLKKHRAINNDETTETIIPQLETITANIGSRKIVLSYPTPKPSSGGLYGSAETTERKEKKPAIQIKVEKLPAKLSQKKLKENNPFSDEPDATSPLLPSKNKRYDTF